MDENEVKVEQLEDVDFEKEEQEKKSKGKKVKKVLIILLIILLLSGIGIGAFFIIQKGSPTKVVEDFVGYFNSGDFESMFGTIDLKGFYTVSTLALENENLEPDYTKFDSEYEKLKDTDEAKEIVDMFAEIDKSILKDYYTGYSITLTSVNDPVLIQNTKNLYKITANVDIIDNSGATTSAKVDFYANKVDKEYKIVYGDLPYEMVGSLLTIIMYSQTVTE